MRNIDVHSHVIPMTIVEAIRRDPQRYGMTIPERDGKLYYEHRGQFNELCPAFYDADAKVDAMERMGIDVSVISVGPPVFFYYLSPEAGLEAARLNNDGIAQMVAKRPDRLRGMAILPMQDPDAAITELERVVQAYGFKGVEIGTTIEGRQLADERFRPLLRTIEQLGCFIFTHPYTCMAKGGMDKYHFINLIGFPLDTTIMVGHLMFSGVLDELTRLKIVLAHGGGYVPYQIGRFAHGHKVRPEGQTKSKTSPYDLLRRFYFDALTHDADAARHLINKVGADRVVLGSDEPFGMAPENLLATIDAIPGLTPAEREQICHRTAEALLGED